MTYPYLLKSVRLTSQVKLAHEFQTSGSMTQDLAAGHDNLKRRIVLERHEFDLVVYREETAGKGDFKIHNIFPASLISSCEPLDPFSSQPVNGGKSRAETEAEIKAFADKLEKEAEPAPTVAKAPVNLAAPKAGK